MRFMISTFVLLTLLSVSPSLGASMCLPPIEQAQMIATDASVGNHGQFVLGGTCSYNPSTQSIECTTAPAARGESYCSASGVQTASDWENEGGYCWCRITAIETPDGILQERNGAYLLGNYFGDATNCNGACAGFCAYYSRSSRGFRRAMMVLTGN